MGATCRPELCWSHPEEIRVCRINIAVFCIYTDVRETPNTLKINGYKSGHQCNVDGGCIACPVTQLQHRVVLVKEFQHAINPSELHKSACRNLTPNRIWMIVQGPSYCNKGSCRYCIQNTNTFVLDCLTLTKACPGFGVANHCFLTQASPIPVTVSKALQRVKQGAGPYRAPISIAITTEKKSLKRSCAQIHTILEGGHWILLSTVRRKRKIGDLCFILRKVEWRYAERWSSSWEFNYPVYYLLKNTSTGRMGN